MTFPKLITLRIKEGMEGGKRGGEERGEGREGREKRKWDGEGVARSLTYNMATIVNVGSEGVSTHDVGIIGVKNKSF